MRAGWISNAGGIGLVVAVLTMGGGAPAQEVMGHPEVGEDVFKRCLACHRVGANARNGVGPVLNGVVGRAAAQYPDYDYSDELKNAGLTWDTATLMQWVMGPQALVPETKMVFPGVADEQEAADVVAYLAQFDENGNVVPTQ